MRPFLRYFLLFACITVIYGQAAERSPQYEQYIKKYKSLAILQQKEYGIPASITLAQGLLESAAGSSRLAVNGNNHFGIKCKDEWRGGKMYHDDDAKDECFRTYRSAEESYIDHSLFLAKRKYYVSLFTLDIYDYKGWATGLQRCGYATDKSYGRKLISLIESYELYKYDRMKPGQIERKKEKKYTPIVDDIYEIKVKSDNEISTANRYRHILEINDTHYIKTNSNDTYDKIAYDTKLSIKRLLKYNEISADFPIKKGDVIFLQAKKKYAPKNSLTHVVAEGESIYSISQKYGMRLETIYNLNKLPKDYVPKPGDILKLRKK
jgi:LysM repeat protein